ncbi:GRIP and coiled-coil domain-containing protein 2-like isoform X2 [Alosa sapidissima]|uniref:GRIP and coiled-coil domain-containing protein 2-like isoform X2 n=1 Tax=Alosa sapidissima TaxID=34773 RepID=UPI001C096C42|nr:GRIP and coiled-coil domain-containing protein 2-like isoform X2 [Alosa sapidissima]
MTWTQVLLVSLFLSPYVLFSANSRHVVSSNNESPHQSIRMLRSLESVMDKYRELITSFKTHGNIDNSTEVETTFIYSCLDLDEKAKTMDVMVKTQRTKIKELENNYFNTRKELREEIVNNRQSEGMLSLRIHEMQVKLNGWIDQLDTKTLSIGKLTLQTLLKYTESKDLERKISREKDKEKKNDLKKQLTKKKEELQFAEQELLAAGGSSILVMQIITLREKIRELENKETDDTEEQIAALRQELKDKLKELEGSPDESSTMVTEITTLQNEILQIYIRLQKFKQESKNTVSELKKQLEKKNSQLKQLRESSDSSTSKQIIIIEKEVHVIESKIEDQQKITEDQNKELQKAIKNKNDQLMEKVTELQEVHNTDYKLILKIITQQFQIGEMQATECTGQKDTKSILVDIQKKLSVKEEEILKLEAKNKRLQQQLQDMSFECSTVLEKLKNLEASLEKNIQKIEGDLKPLLELVALKINRQQIKMSIMAEKSASKIAGLTQQLKEKEREIKQKVQELMAEGLEGSEEAVKIITLLMEIWELQTGVESETTLDRIYKLQNEVNRLIVSLQGSAERKLLLVILAAQTDQTRIKRLKIIISQKYEVELAALNIRLEKSELVLSSKKLEVADKDRDLAKLGKEIKALQSEIDRLKETIEKLKKTTSARIKDLEGQLKIRDRQLEDKTNELKMADKKSGELVIQVTELVEKIKQTEITTYEKDQVLATKISKLEERLETLSKENSECENKNTALQQENEKCSRLQEQYVELQKKTDKLMQNVDGSCKFILQINQLTIDIENLRRSIAQKPDNIAELEKLLKEKLKEMDKLKREKSPGSAEIIKIVEVITTLHKETGETIDKHLQRINELQVLVDSLKNKLKDKTDENTHLVTQILIQKATETMLTKEIATLKKEYATKIKGLQNTVKEKENQLEKEKSKCHKLAARIEELEQELSKSQTDLSNYKKTYAAKIAELEEKLKMITQKLQDAIAKLKAVDKENAEHVLKITQLQTEMTAIANKAVTENEVLNNEIAALKKQLGVCTGQNTKLTHTIIELKINEETIIKQCSLVNDTFVELKKEFDQTITKVDETSQLIFRMNILISEIEELQKKLEGMTGDKTELETELKSKTEQLERVEQQLGVKNRMDSKKIKNILSIIIQKGKTMEESNERYLQQIDELENELNEMIDKFKGKEDENTKLLIKIMSLEEDVTSLQRRISKTKQESTKRIKEIQTQLDQKYKEIKDVKAMNCGNMKERVAELEKEAKKLELDLAKEKQTAENEIKELEKRLTEKKKQLQINSQKLISVDSENGELKLKLVAMETEMTTVISGSKDLEERSAVIIKSLKEKLKVKVEENDQLQNTVTALEQSKKEIEGSCTTIKKQYTDLKTKFDENMNKMEDIPKLILRINMLSSTIARLQLEMKNLSGDKTELRKELEAKMIELKKAEEELGAKSPAATQIKELIAVIHTTSSSTAENNEEYLKRITALEDELDEKIAALQGKESEKIQTMITVMKQQNEIAMLKDRLSKVKKEASKEIAELMKRLQKVEGDLDSSSDKLQSLDKERGKLITKMIAMQDKMDQLISNDKDLKEKTSEVIADLNKQNSIKDEEIAKLKAENEASEKSKQEVINSCATVKQQYTELKTKADKNIKQIEGIPRLILQINRLSADAERLRKAIEHHTGDKTELKMELEKTKEELKKVEEELGLKSPAATQIKELIAVIREKAALKPEDNEEYRNRIAELEAELDEKIVELQGKESEKIQAMIKVMQQQDEITQLKDRLSKVKKDTSKKITELDTALQKKRQEINAMKAEDCKTGKFKVEIDALEREAADLESKLKQLKQSSENKIADLMRRLIQKEDEIKASSGKLETLDKKYGALTVKAIEMENKMNTLLNDDKDLQEKTADEIADLKKQLQEKDKENAKLKAENDELRGSAKEEAKDCAQLRVQHEDMKKQLNRKDEDIATLESAKGKVLGLLTEKEAALKVQQEKANALEAEKKQLQQSLKKKEEVTKELQKKVDDFVKQIAAENAVHISQPAIDPDTAHPKLQLSHSNTQIKLLQTALNVPEGPARYNHVIGALASTGFDKGRQYWEVGVAGKPCYILGVAGETAPRKGAITFDPKNQYWTLMLTRTDILSTAQRKKTKLREVGQAKPRKIGVLIDFKKKEIAFYDAETKALLHTFSNIEVKSKLFPFMSTCEDTEEGSPPMVFNAVASVDWLKS